MRTENEQGISAWVRGVDRRAWIRTVLRSATGVALVASSVAGQQVHDHSASAHTATSGPRADWKPQFLSSNQNSTLVALGERIIPGSTKAGCNQTIDLLMTIESKAHRDELADALAAFDAQAHTHHREMFSELLAEQQDAILTSASTAASPLNGKFQVVKEWVADTYWSSKQGMEEMGWNGQIAWASFPACPHGGEDHTAS